MNRKSFSVLFIGTATRGFATLFTPASAFGVAARRESAMSQSKNQKVRD